VEGYMDVIAYYRAGIKNVMGLMGVNMSSSHINILKKMNNIKTIVLSFDNDDAGTNANINIGKLLVQND
jgi:DNA primase